MSGIAGIIRFDDRPIEHNLIEKMTGSMPYRGPDGINHWVRGSIALGQCMLRTTPESLEETQPLTNEDESLVLVMDGRVDNWEQLRTELLSLGVRLRTRADAELVLRAYETWRKDCLTHIDGDFAFVIWDARLRKALCARDRIGNKPLYYYRDGNTFIFASELHPILAMPGVHQSLNEGMVAEFLADECISRDETFWDDIFRLCPAHQMVVSDAGHRIEQYWSPSLGSTLQYEKEEDFVRHYRDLLFETVRRMSRTQAPLACEVSGGLDSSAIFAVADRLITLGRVTAPSLDGYTLAFEDDPDANELNYSRAVAQHIGRTVREVPPSRMSLDWYSKQAQHYCDFPSYPNGAMGLGIRIAAKDSSSRVLLVGVGGDQWLRGSLTYYADALATLKWREVLASIRSDACHVGLKTSLWWAMRHGAYPLLPSAFRRGLKWALKRDIPNGIDTRAWLAPRLNALLRERLGKKENCSIPITKWISQREHMLTLLSAFQILALELEERMASRVGIELRRPFYCGEMVQFAFSTPAKFRRRGKINKYLHRMALEGLLPEDVLHRQSKAEFSITFAWHLSQLQELFGRSLASPADTWVASDHLSRLLAPPTAQTTGRRAVEMRVMWNLFGCAAAAAS